MKKDLTSTFKRAIGQKFENFFSKGLLTLGILSTSSLKGNFIKIFCLFCNIFCQHFITYFVTFTLSGLLFRPDAEAFPCVNKIFKKVIIRKGFYYFLSNN